MDKKLIVGIIVVLVAVIAVFALMPRGSTPVANECVKQGDSCCNSAGCTSVSLTIASLSCLQGSEPQCLGCSDECAPICTCGPVDNGQIVGGDRDEHGCIGSAGYQWCEAKQKCLRTWEEPCETGGVGLANPASVYCEDQGGTLEIVDTPEGQVGMCHFANGQVCEEWALFRSGGTNCTGGPSGKPLMTDCKPEQRGVQACTLEYRPVCGWFNEGTICDYPCAQTYGNQCGACADPKVEYWTNGECPGLEGGVE